MSLTVVFTKWTRLQEVVKVARYSTQLRLAKVNALVLLFWFRTNFVGGGCGISIQEKENG